MNLNIDYIPEICENITVEQYDMVSFKIILFDYTV